MLLIKIFFFGGGGGGGTLKTLGQVDTSNNLPEWQAVKPTLFAP